MGTVGLRYYCEQYLKTGKIFLRCKAKFPYFQEIIEKYGVEEFAKYRYSKKDFEQHLRFLRHQEQVDIDLKDGFYSSEELRKILKEKNLFIKQIKHQYDVKRTKKSIGGLQITGYKIKRKK